MHAPASVKLPTGKPIKPLIDGAEVFMKQAQSPANFLACITDCLYNVHKYQCSKDDHKDSDSHFMLTLLLEHVVTPWYAGGPRCVENIAMGFAQLADAFGYESYTEDLAGVINAYAYDLHKGGISNEPYLSKQMAGIKSLFYIGQCIYAYETQS